MKNLILVGLILFSLNSYGLNNLTFPGDTIFKKGNEYIVRVTKPGMVNIAVYAMINGKRRMMGTMPFRVKRIPDPIAKVAGINNGNIPKTKLIAQNKINAVLEHFDFDARFTITKFTVSTTYKDFEISKTCHGNTFTKEVEAILKKVKRGKKVYFEDIRARGPDGTMRSLGAVVLKVI